MNKITYAAIISIIISVNPIVAQIVDLGGGVYLTGVKKENLKRIELSKLKTHQATTCAESGDYGIQLKTADAFFQEQTWTWTFEDSNEVINDRLYDLDSLVAYPAFRNGKQVLEEKKYIYSCDFHLDSTRAIRNHYVFQQFIMVNLPPIHEKDVDLQADLIGKYLGAKGIPTNQQWWATDPDTINNSLPTKVLIINGLAYDSLGKIIPESLIMAVKPVNDADIIPPGVGERTAYGMAAVTKVYDVSADRKSYKWELKGVCCGGYGELYNNHFVVPKYPGLLAYEIDAKSEPVPEVGFINSLVASGKYLFAGTPFGIYRSSDNGINWI